MDKELQKEQKQSKKQGDEFQLIWITAEMNQSEGRHHTTKQRNNLSKIIL